VPTQDPTLPPDLYLLALFPRPRCQVRGLMPTGAASSGAEHEADPQSMWSHSPLRASREAWRPPNDKQISCKRPERTYGPLWPLGANLLSGAPASPRLSAAFAG
jgi:hypothetical protein